jgi:HK97 family phage prohead protease
MDPIIGTELERTFTIDRKGKSGSNGKVKYRVSLSSETPARQFFGTEVLIHTRDAIDMTRAARGLTLLFNHDVDTPIGIIRKIQLRDKRLEGEIEFSTNSERAKQIKAEVDDGFMSDISLRYTIDAVDRVEGVDGADDEIRVKRWTPLEGSVVSVPADPSVGIGRSKNTMTLASTTPKEAVQAERDRVTGINTLFAATRFQDKEYTALRDKLISEGGTLERAHRELLDLISTEPPADPITPPGGGASRGTPNPIAFPHIVPGQDLQSEFGAAAVDGILTRAGIPVKDPHPGTIDFQNKRLVDIAEASLSQWNHETRGLSTGQIISRALEFGRRDMFVGHGTSAFTSILANVADKAASFGFLEASSQHRQFIRIGTLRDFKPASRVSLSEFTDVEVVKESGEYKHGSYGEQGAIITAAKYGRLFAITREALINDDVSVFSQVPRGMAGAAARAERDFVFNLLTSGTAPDGNSVWDAGHNNTGSGVLSVTSVGAGYVAMAKQTGPKGTGILNIQPFALIVPAELRMTAEVLAAAAMDPAEGATTSFMAPNPFRGKLEIISDAYLSNDSALKWYLVANPMMRDTIELAFVGGQSEPHLETRDGWTVDGIEYKVRHEYGGNIIDWRGMYRSTGA